METVLAQLRSLARTADETGRKNLLDGLRDLSYSIESQQESLWRILYLPLQLAAVRIGMNMNLFSVLVTSKTPLTVEEIASRTEVKPDLLLLTRLLRYLASIGDIAETGKGQYAANNITHALTIPGFEGGIDVCFASLMPACQVFPELLIENNYSNITDPAKTPFQKAHNTDLPLFAWAQAHPEWYAQFNKFMSVHRLGMPTWLDFYPYKGKIAGLEPDRPFFVDVGGGMGHQSVALRSALPDVQNSIIVQDLGETLKEAIRYPGVEFQEHDFRQPQPLKGAKIYYMRNIIHDYPDDKAVVILKNLKQALAPDSVILIDDMVMPETGARWETTQMDLAMMVVLGAFERTQGDWQDLIAKAGLKIVKMYRYTVGLQDHVIECVLA